MSVIGHENEKVKVPISSPFIKASGFKEAGRDLGLAQLIGAPFSTAYRNEKDRI
jgi:hypothetical protein